MEKRWTILPTDTAATIELQRALKIHPTLCQILVQRGITTFEKARDFFRPDLQHLHNPWLMKDMDKAVSRITKALQHHERILIYGDYDVDGTTAVACMYHFLSTQTSHLDFYIPHRYREGYGISKAGVHYAHEHQFSLIIALDCGIKSVELVAYAASLGIDFIICDHHLPDESLPEAVAILNPKQTDCNYPYKDLCGCGVGFKLISALCEKLQINTSINQWTYLDLVATAIAADIVPMTGENRILAYFGLKKINENPNPGIKALITLSNAKMPVSIHNLVFMIAPRVNAAGRMDDARKAVLLFIAPDETTAFLYAEQLHTDNTNRKEADNSITEEARLLLETMDGWMNKKTTVVYQPHWHKGVVGIVASRLTEFCYRPTVVLTESGEYAAGSARSVAGFNLYEAIHACREFLIGYGGHFAAAGLTLKKENIEAFRQRFEEVVATSITNDQLIPEIIIDTEVNFDQLTHSFYNIIRQMEPFGPDNMTPVFLAKNVRNAGYSKIVKEKHIRFDVIQNQHRLSGIGFNLAHKFNIVETNQPFNMVFKLEENEWYGEKHLQLKVEDIRCA